MTFDFWGSLQLMRKHYARSMEPVCHEFGVTRAELDVLTFLDAHPNRDRASDIVEFRGLTKSHVSVAAKNLTERGLLEPIPDHYDGRVTHLKLTDRAKPIIAAGREAQKQYFNLIFACYDREELETFRNIHLKLFEHMKNIGDE